MATLAPYPSPEEREAALDEAVRQGAEVHTYGQSVAGRPLRVARIPRLGRGHDEPPRVLVCANIHGPEFIGTVVALGLLRAATALRADGGVPELLARLLERAELWIVPSVNPDGYARTWERGGVGTLQALRTNARGVDLNRNFPRPAPPPWYAHYLGDWATGSDQRGSPFYRGEAPLSEPESRGLDELFTRHRFVASANLHSTAGTIFHAHVKTRQEQQAYARLARAFRRAQRHHAYCFLSSVRFDWFTGEQEDHQHHVHGTWAITVEHFPLLASYRQHLVPPSIFWRFNPRDPTPWVANDVPALVAFFLAALGEGRPADHVR